MVNNNYEYCALGAYKEELFNLLLNINKNPLCELLIDLMMPSLIDDRFDKLENFIGGEHDYYGNGEREIVKIPRHIFDIPFIYSTVTDTRNVICIDTNITKNNQSTKELAVTISIMFHKDLLQLDLETRRKYKKLGYISMNRLDIATALLGDILNYSDIKSIGKLQPIPHNPIKSYYPNNDFFGKILEYTATDFMIDYGKWKVGVQ